MALTLAEAAKLSNDLVMQGVIETIIQDSPILRLLPFIEITGNGLTYNRENAAAAAAFFSVGDTWTESTPNNLARTSGTFLQTDRDQFGQMVQFYDGVPIGVSDYISDAKTVGTSTDCSTVYAMQFGEGALAGLSAPGGLQIEDIGSLETKDATRTRVKWYVSTALFNVLKVSKLTGVRP